MLSPTIFSGPARAITALKWELFLYTLCSKSAHRAIYWSYDKVKIILNEPQVINVLQTPKIAQVNASGIDLLLNCHQVDICVKNG